MGRNLHDSSLAGTITAKAGADATNDDKGELNLRRAETLRPPLQHLRSLGRTLLIHVAHQISNISPSSALRCQTFFPPAYPVNSIESPTDASTLLSLYSSSASTVHTRIGFDEYCCDGEIDDTHRCDGEIDDFG